MKRCLHSLGRRNATAPLAKRSGPRPGALRFATAGISPSGFTLLEIIISLAILAGSLAALGEVIRSATQSGTMAEYETRAQILAASIMDELVAGSRDLVAVDGAVLDTTDDPPWVYSVEIGTTNYEELVAVRVRVEQQLEARLRPARFELARWLSNATSASTATEDEESGTSNSTSSSSTSGGSSSGSSIGGGQP
jgi:prepilin-type N-terminal cleavage/methylation domain-containing protein